MGPRGVWQAWEAEISRVLSTVGVWQRHALALCRLGVAPATQCGLARAAAVEPELGLVPSTTRRFERLLASARLDVRAARGEVAALLPPDARVVLMTARGLAWPARFDQCRRGGWSFLCRVQRQPCVQTADGHDGTRWQGHGRAFLKSRLARPQHRRRLATG